MALSSLVNALVFLSTTTRSASCSAASRRRVLPARSRGRTDARIFLAYNVVMSFLAFPGVSSSTSRSSARSRTGEGIDPMVDLFECSAGAPSRSPPSRTLGERVNALQAIR
jgi:hypothetical protein